MRLSAKDKAALGHMQVFLAEKHFEGVGGLELTDEIRVTIAGQACLLLLHRETGLLPGSDFHSWAHPSGYTAREERYHLAAESGKKAARIGWVTPADDLARWCWRGTRSGAAPRRPMTARISFSTNSRTSWIRESEQRRHSCAGDARRLSRVGARVMSAEGPNTLRNAANAGEATMLNDYGATNPAEFFAVITEAFFEQPRALKRKHPALFAQRPAVLSSGSNDLFLGDRPMHRMIVLATGAITGLQSACARPAIVQDLASVGAGRAIRWTTARSWTPNTRG